MLTLKNAEKRLINNRVKNKYAFKIINDFFSLPPSLRILPQGGNESLLTDVAC